MKKKLLFLLILVLISISSLDAVPGNASSITAEEALTSCFKSSGAEILESTVSCWAKLNSRFMDVNAINAEMSKTVDFIGMDAGSIEKTVEKGAVLNKVLLFGTKDNKAYHIAIESAKQDPGGETYIVVDVTIDKDYEALGDERKKLALLLSGKKSRANFSSCIIGTYKGKLSSSEIDRKTNIAMRPVNAIQVEGVENEDLSCVTAFSNNVGEYVLSDNRKVNLQIAMRYSLYDNKTYIWIGTPLIPTEY